MVWIIIEATVAMMMMLKPRHQLLPRGDKGRRSLLGASADLLKHHSSSMALPRNLKNNENFSDPQCNIGVETCTFCPTVAHYSKSQIFVQKFNFDKTLHFSRKSKLSTTKKCKSSTFSRVFHQSE